MSMLPSDIDVRGKLTAGSLIVGGEASVTGDLKVKTINGKPYDSGGGYPSITYDAHAGTKITGDLMIADRIINPSVAEDISLPFAITTWTQNAIYLVANETPMIGDVIIVDGLAGPPITKLDDVYEIKDLFRKITDCTAITFRLGSGITVTVMIPDADDHETEVETFFKNSKSILRRGQPAPTFIDGSLKLANDLTIGSTSLNEPQLISLLNGYPSISYNSTTNTTYFLSNIAGTAQPVTYGLRLYMDGFPSGWIELQKDEDGEPPLPFPFIFKIGDLSYDVPRKFYVLENDPDLLKLFKVSDLMVRFSVNRSYFQDVISFESRDALDDKSAEAFRKLALTGLIATAEVGQPTLNITGNLRLGSTTLTEPQLVALLALLSSS